MTASPKYVYFLRPVGHSGPVKIGISKVPEERLVAFCKWSPVPLEIAATIPGTWRLEKQFHAYFRSSHSHHEWFFADPKIDRTIDDINAGRFKASVLPEPFAVGNVVSEVSCILKGITHRFRRLENPAPERVERAYDRAIHHLQTSEYDPRDDIRIVWEHLEKVAPRPKARGHLLIERYLSDEKDAA